jgi:DNA-binding NarL/FixJ family response regulator
MGTQIPVCLHAEDPISKAGLEAVLRWQPEIALIEPEAEELPVVSVVSAEAFGDTVIRTMRHIQARGCTRLVLVTSALSDADLLPAVEAGVCAIVWRFEATSARLGNAVVRAASGKVTLPSEVLARLLREVSRLQHHVLSPLGLGLGGLSSREVDVLRLAADGLDTGEIAAKLSYSKRTVVNIMHDVTSRFQLSNRTHAVAYAIREGLI